jgi:UDP-N-acetylmuramate dehydrogenase
MTGDLTLAERILRDACGSRLRTAYPLAPLTSFRIGGPADLYLEPQDEADLEAAGRAVRATGVGVAILGKGSNVLVADAGFRGLVLRLGHGFRWVARDGERLTAGGSMPLPALAGVALRHTLAGLEFGVAIPASLGGAVRMNAGAHDREMADVVERIEVFSLSEGVTHGLAAAEADFAYRRSALPDDWVITGATLRLASGEPASIRVVMDEAREWRRATQPLAEPNCGSVFENPPGRHAASLIEAAGLKGARVGGATVSSKHANFIIAGPRATAEDIMGLIRTVRERVLQDAGVSLQTEVRVLGGSTR